MGREVLKMELNQGADDINFEFNPLPAKTDEALESCHNRARADYETWKRDFLEWLTVEGRKPDKLEGFADGTVRKTNYHTDQIMRWVWENRGYTTELTPEDADELMRELGRYSDYENANLNNFVKTIKRIFSYYNHEKAKNIEWSCNYEISEPKVTNRDYFKKDEFRPLYEAALKYGTVKHYNSCSKAERKRLKGHLARRFDKNKEGVSIDDFDRANSFKIPSLIATTLDMGLRPIEVARTKPEWIHLDDAVLRIPATESTKNRDNWECVLSNKSVRTLRKWLDERQSYGKYATSDSLWLNDKGNPYNSQSLNYLLRALIESAGVEPAGRDLTWYSIRHGVATVWADEEDIHDAREQLRHVKVETTMRYSHSSTKKRHGAVNSKY